MASRRARALIQRTCDGRVGEERADVGVAWRWQHQVGVAFGLVDRRAAEDVHGHLPPVDHAAIIVLVQEPPRRQRQIRDEGAIGLLRFDDQLGVTFVNGEGSFAFQFAVNDDWTGRSFTLRITDPREERTDSFPLTFAEPSRAAIAYEPLSLPV